MDSGNTEERLGNREKLKLKAKQSVCNHKYFKNFELDPIFLGLFPLLSSK